MRRSLSQVKKQFILKEPKCRSGKRVVALPMFALTALQEHRAARFKAGTVTGPVFGTKAGVHLQRSNALREFRTLVARANKAEKMAADEAKAHPELVPEGIRFHDLRHTRTSALVAAGHSLKAVPPARTFGRVDDPDGVRALDARRRQAGERGRVTVRVSPPIGRTQAVLRGYSDAGRKLKKHRNPLRLQCFGKG